MNIIHKIISILIASWIFVFLIFVTFITNNLSSLEKPSYEIEKQWTFELIKENDSIYLKEHIEWNTGSILMKKLNISDKVIYSNSNVETKNSSWSIFINVTTWIYFFQLNEINSKYIVSWEWFEINNKWPWKFIVNNLNPRKIMVFSLDNLLWLKLRNPKTNEEITNIALYPHEYLVFNPIKSIFVKNSDLLKIDQTFTLWYYNSQIEDSEEFLHLVSLKDLKAIDVISYGLNFFEKEKIEKNKNINNYVESKFWFLPWEKIMDKYFIMFINPNKKSLYYQNLIIRQINELLKINEIDNSLINNINQNLKSLKIIDSDAEKEIQDFITYNYINVSIADYSINSKINFSKLINKINNKWTPTFLNSLLFLDEVFNNYNSDDFYENINEFTKKYFEELNVSIDWSDKSKLSISDIKEVDYLLYFLENIMLNSNESSTKNVWDIVNIFDNYTNIANSFYKNSNEEIKRIWLFTSSKILNKFIKIIYDTYFITNEDNQLLEIKDWINIIKKDVNSLEKSVNNIFSFFENNKIVLDIDRSTKDKFLNEKIYPELIKKYKEYFHALNDYEEYLSIYDISKKELLETSSINENNNSIEISIDKAKEYLQFFNWVQFNNTNIKIMDYIYCINPSEENENIELENPYCYKIDNLSIDRQNISLILYPFLENKIDHITIDSIPKTWTYKLNEMKSILDEKLKTAKINRELYEFENFLLNTFWKKINLTNNNQTQNNTEEIITEQEDPVIRIFKRNKLLWELWDFAKILNIFNIEYNNLEVERNWDEYNIYINWANFSLGISKNESYRWIISSDYDFSEKHSFINPSIKLLEKKIEKYLLLWNVIYITWEYGVNNIEEEIKELFSFYKEIDYVITNIHTISWNNKIDIMYDKESKLITFNTNFNWEKLSLELLNWYIINWSYSWNKIVENKISYESLESILNTITN